MPSSRRCCRNGRTPDATMIFAALSRAGTKKSADVLAFTIQRNPSPEPPGLAFAATLRTSRPPAGALPFAAGAVDSDGGGNTNTAWPVASCTAVQSTPVLPLSSELQLRTNRASISNSAALRWSVGLDVSRCFALDVGNLPAVTRCSSTQNTPSQPLGQCLATTVAAMLAQQRCAETPSIPSLPKSACVSPVIAAVFAQKGCAQPQSVPTFARQIVVDNPIPLAWAMAACRAQPFTPSIPPRCDFYDIVIEPPEPPYQRPCGDKPPADALAFCAKLKTRHRADQLPFPLACRCDGGTPSTPLDTGYIMYNDITCTVKTDNGDVPIGLIDASIKTSMDDFCWVFAGKISAADFDKLGFATHAPGDAPIITLNLNGTRYDVLAEDYSDNRAFIGNSYTLRGRSITALLASDYAQRDSQSYTSDYTAQYLAGLQIRNTYLNDEQVRVEWQAADWVIPAGTYQRAEATPVSVIADLAAAGGAFVTSHDFLPTFIIRRRWPVPAWEVSTQTPARDIPAVRIESISGQRRVAEQCHAILVNSETEGQRVYRLDKGKTPLASAISNPLYCHVTARREAGIAALSDTGTHKIEQVKLPIDPDRGVPRANLGEIWQFNEGDNGQNASIWDTYIVGDQVFIDVTSKTIISKTPPITYSDLAV